MNEVEIVLDPDQRRVLQEFFKHNISIITGGPGTGKSFITKSIVDILQSKGKTVGLCAPTGKAARRLAAAVNTDGADWPAYTIHRLFRGNPITNIWAYNEYNKLDVFDWIICDEASMIDIVLARNLLRALPTTTSIIFVGDVDQLAPVGPGSFFKDIIRSDIFPVFYLRTNHRQGAGSLIAENALRINAGSMKLSFGTDLIFEEASNPIEMRSRIKHLIVGLKKDYDNNINFLHNSQILSPQHKTVIGVQAMNKLLRFWINPRAQPYEPFSVGDKVMQMSNDYNLNIFNGTVGMVMHGQPNKYVVDFGDAGIIDYPRQRKTKFNPSGTNLSLAYCSTVHKFQGSECDCGILIISSSHTWMLTRNLLYTGMTRFKKRCILLADRQGLKRAIRNDSEQLRYTRFVERLHAANSEGGEV